MPTKSSYSRRLTNMTARWTRDEFRQLLAEDRQLRVLVVEGPSDIKLWHKIAPSSCRKDTEIYPVTSFHVEVDLGGNKARVAELARSSVSWPEAERLKFFADADCDRFMQVDHPDRLNLTDGRDVESYVLIGAVLECFCEIGAGERPAEAAIIGKTIRDLLRPIGLLRIASARENLNLPFKETFVGGSVSRFFKDRRGRYSLSLDALVDALLNQAELPRQMKPDLINLLERTESELSDVEDWQIVHGKDLISFFSWYFAVSLPISFGLICLSIVASLNAVLAYESFSEIEGWVRGSTA